MSCLVIEKENKRREENLAFLIGPRLDGIIQIKDGTLLNLHANPLLTNQQTLKAYEPQIESTVDDRLPDGRRGQDRPTWTSTLMMVQRRTLKMKYKIKTKQRAKLMREIRRKVNWTSPIIQALNGPTPSLSTSQMKRLLTLAPEPIPTFDTAQAYLGRTDPGRILRQCMNAIIDSTKTTPKKRKMQIQIRVAVQRKQKKKKDKNVFPIVVPGTPDQPEQNKTERAQQGQNQDEDLTLYYKVFNRYRPEAGESNAESAARTAALEAEYQYLLMKKKTKSEPKKKRTKTTQLHSLSPSTPPRQTVRFNKAPCPTIKPITIQEDRETLCLNNVQDIPLDTDYCLYPTPD